MPRDTCKVRFTSEAMVYHLPVVNKATPVPSPPKRLRKICRARSNQRSSGEGTSLDPHATEPHFPPISQLVVPAQPEPRKNKDFEATRSHAHPGELVIPAAPKTTVNQAIRPLPQHTSAQIAIPSGPKKARRISTTCQSLLMLFLPSESKASHSRLDSVQSMPGPSNPISAPNVFNKPEDIMMDYMDVDPSPSQINPSARLQKKAFSLCSGTSKSKWVGDVPTSFGKSDPHASPILYFDYGGPDAHNIGQEWFHLQTDLCMDPITENHFADTLATRLSYQATPDPRKIDYKEGLDDSLKRAMEDYQRMFSAACKRHQCVLEQQKRLVAELETLHMERNKYII
ncbi:hypothetical protein PAXRUDRAFT_171626 [Paxillus rubicundulus Ve08.2h10]|uniref:Uncharacterized protein n=1 Tax=Paxillus rubicundulus Ve08.2h10 TaxID=930991 RepID=A0A0D0CHH0_9AGAM|nr:hypothetical protein PAXRUDRAFT_174954 [Paxillus rubicundulus Ve08.2h10]KIK75812.1 hypothetical protein PAXRUDRAFT_171626 [Paxillus rubicundulus Ve08.2h10]